MMSAPAPPAASAASTPSGGSDGSYASFETNNAETWGIVVTVLVIGFFDILFLVLHDRSPIREALSRCFPCLRWRHWPLTFISNMRDGLGPATRPLTWWAFDVLDPAHLITSFCLPSWCLLVLHVLCFCYFIVYVLLDVLLYYRQPGADVHNPYWQWLTFLTNWSIAFYALASFTAAVNTLRFLLTRWRLARDTTPQLATTSYVHHAAATNHGALPAPRNGDLHHGDDSGGHGDIVGGQGTTPLPVLPPSRSAEPAGLGQAAEEQQQVGSGSAGLTKAAGSMAAGAGGNQVLLTGPGGQPPPLHHPNMRWDWLSVAHLLLMEVFTTTAWFVGFFYWVAIVALVQSDVAYREATTYLPHGGSAVLAGVQILLTRLPIVSQHFPALLLYANCYLLMLWIYGSITGTWRYGLNWEYAPAVGAFVLLMPILFLWFSIWYFVAKLRRWCCLGGMHHPPVEYKTGGSGTLTGVVRPIHAHTAAQGLGFVAAAPAGLEVEQDGHVSAAGDSHSAGDVEMAVPATTGPETPAGAGGQIRTG